MFFSKIVLQAAPGSSNCFSMLRNTEFESVDWAGRGSGRDPMCEAGRDTSRGMFFRQRCRGCVRSISGRSVGLSDLLRGRLMRGQYSSGSKIVLDARSASVMSQMRIFGAMWYEEKIRAPPVTASRFALISSGDRFDQSPVTWRSSNVAELTEWAINAA